jgi:CDP-diacylglycerol--glycerol-3-phosphate 3-phosphatidyltransferase
MSMNQVLDKVRDGVRAIMRVFARALNALSGGKLSPNVVTIVGLLAHLPIAYFIAVGKLPLAAILLVIFGLFDTLDGELARLQKRTSSIGMFLDSATDRMKEVFLYGGIVYYLISQNLSWFTVWAIVALGGSMLTSYLNAQGDVAMSQSNPSHKVNKTFRGGLLRFEVRMFIIFIALLSDRLPLAMVVIGILSWCTAIYRLIFITRRLKNV